MTSAQYQTLLARLDRMDRRIDESAEETRRYVDRSNEETRRHFDVVAEGLEGKIQLVAEGVAGLAEQLVAVRRECAAENAETRTLLILSYGQLDRRVTALESSVRHLEAPEAG
jgi:hypothetical protein